MEKLLDKKQIWAIFLFDFKMGCKTAETTHNINNTFGPGTANGHPAQWWFKKFCKGDESLEDEEPSGRSLEAGNDQLRAPSKLILLQLHNKLPKNSASTILWSFGIWSKLEGQKSSIRGCLRNWLKIKNIIILKGRLLLLYAAATNHFLIGSWCVMESGFYTTTSNDQLSGWHRKLQRL